MLNLSAGSSSYNIQRSLRFRSSASAYLNRTFNTPTNQQIWTFSTWCKLGVMSNDNMIFGGTTTNAQLYFAASGILRFEDNNAAVAYTTAVYRDPSAWYHVVLTINTGASGTNKVRLYVNGVEITTFSTDNRSTYTTSYFNRALTHTIGKASSQSLYFDGYLTEVNFIDGQALTPASFGQTDPASGAWVPLKYTGTYGTNGFYLPFSNNSSTTTLGYDFSGNGNNWTTNNISLTAGATYDSMTDVPTAGSTNGNYAVLNPLSNGNTLSNANLRAVTGTNTNTLGTMAVSSGKWYIEFTITTAGGAFPFVGITPSTEHLGSSGTSWVNNSVACWAGNGGFSNGDVCGFAFDLDGLTFTAYKNGVALGSSYFGNNTSGLNTIASGRSWVPALSGVSSTIDINFGQRPFAYTPPTGFKALHTGNLPEPSIKFPNKHMDATLYTGSSSSQIITNSGSMQPDLVWVKTRNASTSHEIYDSVRGAGIRLCSNETSADNPLGANGLTSFNSNGFTVPSTANYGINSSGYTYVGWQWKAGGTTVTNTTGTISSQVSANPTSGFSIVTYTGNGTAGATVGHGLGVAPKMIIVKNRSYGGSWRVYHSVLGNTQNVRLNLTNATATDSGIWNNTSPTSSVFTVGNDADVNRSGDPHVAYCFAEIPGYSKFGSYTGNGSTDGPFVYCGFRPKYVLIKNTTSVGSYDWEVYDTSRDAYNAAGNRLFPDLSGAESPSASLDILSNGFKLRQGSGGDLNTTAATHIYAAFAENPFKYANAR